MTSASGGFADSYLGRLRRVIGPRLVLMPGARCVLSDADGRVLLHLRGDTRTWSLPGGAAEEGDGLLDTVVREVREETGLTPLDPVAWGHASDPAHEITTYPNGDQVHAFALAFWATRWTGALTADGDETLDLMWAAPGDLPDGTVPAHRRTVLRWLRHRETGVFQLF